jgi:hypothetical protein
MLPHNIPPVDAPEALTTFFGEFHFTPSLERRFMLIVVLTGAVGSYIHAATAFVDHLGNREFLQSWAWRYLLTPCIGVALALLIYLGVRGGLISGSAELTGAVHFGWRLSPGWLAHFPNKPLTSCGKYSRRFSKADHPTEGSDKLTS